MLETSYKPIPNNRVYLPHLSLHRKEIEVWIDVHAVLLYNNSSLLVVLTNPVCDDYDFVSQAFRLASGDEDPVNNSFCAFKPRLGSSDSLNVGSLSIRDPG